jgi:fido (protein-threonine AMPylation protein)
MQITDNLLQSEQLELSPGARESLVTIYKKMAQTHDRENGNGRAVRNLLERAKREQALRLMALPGKKSKEQLMLLVEEDFAGALAEMDGCE